MKVADVMTREVRIADPSESLRDIACAMTEDDIGFMPVGENDRLVGSITDRDIVTRAIATGKDGTARVRDVMTRDVKYCYADEPLEHVVANMGDNKVRRLPVVDRDKRLVGVVSLGDAALAPLPRSAGEALSRVVEPGGPHAGGRRG